MAAAAKKGLKRICTSCGTRFYDFEKRPIICPDCETEFTGDIKVKNRRSRTAAITDAANDAEGQVSKKAAKEPKAEDDLEEEEEPEADVVSLDEAADLEAAGDDDDDDVAAAGINLDDDNLDDIDVVDDDDLEDDLEVDLNENSAEKDDAGEDKKGA